MKLPKTDILEAPLRLCKEGGSASESKAFRTIRTYFERFLQNEKDRFGLSVISGGSRPVIKQGWANSVYPIEMKQMPSFVLKSKTERLPQLKPKEYLDKKIEALKHRLYPESGITEGKADTERAIRDTYRRWRENTSGNASATAQATLPRPVIALYMDPGAYRSFAMRDRVGVGDPHMTAAHELGHVYTGGKSYYMNRWGSKKGPLFQRTAGPEKILENRTPGLLTTKEEEAALDYDLRSTPRETRDYLLKDLKHSYWKVDQPSDFSRDLHGFPTFNEGKERVADTLAAEYRNWMMSSPDRRAIYERETARLKAAMMRRYYRDVERGLTPATPGVPQLPNRTVTDPKLRQHREELEQEHKNAGMLRILAKLDKLTEQRHKETVQALNNPF